MKLTVKQYKILSALYHDYTAIDTEADLKKRKILLADYRAIPEIFGEVQRHWNNKVFYLINSGILQKIRIHR